MTDCCVFFSILCKGIWKYTRFTLTLSDFITYLIMHAYSYALLSFNFLMCIFLLRFIAVIYSLLKDVETL